MRFFCPFLEILNIRFKANSSNNWGLINQCPNPESPRENTQGVVQGWWMREDVEEIVVVIIS